MDVENTDRIELRGRLLRWAIVLLVAGGIMLIPVPEGVTPQSWRLLAIFAATIMGSIVQPIPGAAIVLLGVTALPLFNVMRINEALTGYADPVVWLVLAAFFISRGMIKTGLGRRIAFLFIKA
ncbi:MAG TPA: SLC13 family permease, partial [Pyrinomonadaceae bacterium]|nr:SLC13 family permease [Pyrinomonadaceae bacterium]